MSKDNKQSPRADRKNTKSHHANLRGSTEKLSDDVSTSAAAASKNESINMSNVTFDERHNSTDGQEAWQHNVRTIAQSCSVCSHVIPHLTWIDIYQKSSEQLHNLLKQKHQTSVTQQHSKQIQELTIACKSMATSLIETAHMLEESHTTPQSLTKLEYDEARQAEYEAMTLPERFYKKSGDLSILLQRQQNYQANHQEEVADRQFLVDHEQPVDPPDEIFDIEHAYHMQQFKDAIAELELERDRLEHECHVQGHHLHEYREHDNGDPLTSDIWAAIRETPASSQPPKDLSKMSLDELADYANITFPPGLDVEHIKLGTLDGSASPPAQGESSTKEYLQQWLQHDHASQAST